MKLVVVESPLASKPDWVRDNYRLAWFCRKCCFWYYDAEQQAYPQQPPRCGCLGRNLLYARAAMQDCFRRGEAPFASHLLYPGTLDDTIPEQRMKGMSAGWLWGMHADLIAVYTDLGFSKGMLEGIDYYTRLGIPIQERSLPEWKEVKQSVDARGTSDGDKSDQSTKDDRGVLQDIPRRSTSSGGPATSGSITDTFKSVISEGADPTAPPI